MDDDVPVVDDDWISGSHRTYQTGLANFVTSIPSSLAEEIHVIVYNLARRHCYEVGSEKQFFVSLVYERIEKYYNTVRRDQQDIRRHLQKIYGSLISLSYLLPCRSYISAQKFIEKVEEFCNVLWQTIVYYHPLTIIDLDLFPTLYYHDSDLFAHDIEYLNATMKETDQTHYLANFKKSLGDMKRMGIDEMEADMAAVLNTADSRYSIELDLYQSEGRPHLRSYNVIPLEKRLQDIENHFPHEGNMFSHARRALNRILPTGLGEATRHAQKAVDRGLSFFTS